jgi:phosphate/sulfate permease
MLTHLDPASALAIGLLIFALIMVILFEATNGFHDAANAVATVIYTKSLQPGPAVAMLVSLFVAALATSSQGTTSSGLAAWSASRRSSSAF